MSEHELERLLGGFAADQLTAEEKQRLYTAALRDQQLFNALADEQALKELLTDPAVRRRLLQVLNQANSSGAGSVSWLDRFRRPANLALAGGLATAIFALVLGTKVYQDSLRQAVQTVATEETKQQAPSVQAPAASQPAAPPVAEPEGPAPKKGMPSKPKAEQDTSVAVGQPGQQETADANRVGAAPSRERDESRRQADTPVAALSKTAEQPASSAGQKLSPQGSSPAAVPAQTPMRAPADVPILSARTLYYGQPGRSDSDPMVQESEGVMRSSNESVQQFGALERKKDRLEATGTTADANAKPLGLKYGFVVREADGQERIKDALTQVPPSTQVTLFVEANQASYVQVWKTAETSGPQLLFPTKESGQISSKLTSGQRQSIPLPPEKGVLTIRLSRLPFGPITRQEAVLLDRPASDQLHESILQEQVTYVVNPDLSPTVQLSVVIPVGSP